MLDNTKAQKETLQMFRQVGKTKKKPFLAGFPARNKQSPRGSVGNHKRIHLRQNFPKTSGNYLLQNISVKLVPLQKLDHVHPLVKEMFPEELK